jgi:hypothetical protein
VWSLARAGSRWFVRKRTNQPEDRFGKLLFDVKVVGVGPPCTAPPLELRGAPDLTQAPFLSSEPWRMSQKAARLLPYAFSYDPVFVEAADACFATKFSMAVMISSAVGRSRFPFNRLVFA